MPKRFRIVRNPIEALNPWPSDKIDLTGLQLKDLDYLDVNHMFSGIRFKSMVHFKTFLEREAKSLDSLLENSVQNDVVHGYMRGVSGAFKFMSKVLTQSMRLNLIKKS